MSEKATYKFEIKDIDCADCAAKLESKIKEIEGIENVSLSFMTETLTYDCDHDLGKQIGEQVRAIVAKEEPDAKVTSKGHKHHHEHHHEEADHHHEHEEHHHEHEEKATYKFEIKDIDCADCAAKLESKIKEIEGIENVTLSFMTETLTYDCDHDLGKQIEEQMRAIVAKEEPDAKVTSKGHKHHHEHHHEEADHHHEHYEGLHTYKYQIKDIDCADCAAKLEGKLAEIEGIHDVNINFMKETLSFACKEDSHDYIYHLVVEKTAQEEPDAKISALKDALKMYRFKVEGLDCANCAAHLEHEISEIEGIENVSLDFMTSNLVYECVPNQSAIIERTVREVIQREEPEAVFSAISQTKAKEAKEEKEDHSMLYRLIAGAVLFVIGLFMKDMMQIFIMLCAYLVLGWDVLYKAVKGIGRGQVFDEHFLMAVATIAAIYLKDFKEAAGVMLFYQIGEYFQDMAVKRSRKSIGELMDIRPEYAVVQRNGEWIQTDPEEVYAGDLIMVKPGERIPLDGVITHGSSSLNTASLTGEAKPRDVDPGDEVISGSVNETGVLEIKVTKEYGESTVARILDLVENQETRKASQENFITKFSRVYTPAVVFSAIVVAVIVSLMGYGVREGIERACTFLVISCPCALVISIPLSFFAGIGGLSSRGILVKGANLIETLANVEQIVMDKTGTLTSGTFAVEEMHGDDQNQLLEDAAYAEYYSNHPIAQGIKEAYGKEIIREEILNVKEIAGRGLSIERNGHQILAGNAKLMLDNGIAFTEYADAGTCVYVARDNVYEGCLILRDQLKSDAKEAIRTLQDAGKKCIIVSGDNQKITDEIAKQLHADQFFGNCMPEDKVEHVKTLKEKGLTAFVGDGVNDAPVLTSADIGFAMGALGSDAAIEAADVVIMDDQPSKISLAITSAKRILRIANENIYGAIIIKIGTLILGAFGIANMWMAIFADTGVAMLCVLNSMRLLHIARKD